MQDLIAIAVAVVAAAWIARTFWRQTNRPACGTIDAVSGADGFVPLDDLVQRPRKKSGRP